jgi:hypothetical protein
MLFAGANWTVYVPLLIGGCETTKWVESVMLVMIVFGRNWLVDVVLTFRYGVRPVVDETVTVVLAELRVLPDRFAGAVAPVLPDEPWPVQQ